jgi:hypothetical protein
MDKAGHGGLEEPGQASLAGKTRQDHGEVPFCFLFPLRSNSNSKQKLKKEVVPDLFQSKHPTLRLDYSQDWAGPRLCFMETSRMSEDRGFRDII